MAAIPTLDPAPPSVETLILETYPFLIQFEPSPETIMSARPWSPGDLIPKRAFWQVAIVPGSGKPVPVSSELFFLTPRGFEVLNLKPEPFEWWRPRTWFAERRAPSKTLGELVREYPSQARRVTFVVQVMRSQLRVEEIVLYRQKPGFQSLYAWAESAAAQS